MEGFDIHVDTSIGKHFSALFKIMTPIAGDEDEDEADIDTIDYGSSNGDQTPQENQTMNRDNDLYNTGIKLRRGSSVLKDLSLDTKKKSRIIEKELNEQANNNQFEIVLRQRLFNFWDEMKIYFVERLVLGSEDDA
jgi:hypothetical protein